MHVPAAARAGADRAMISAVPYTSLASPAERRALEPPARLSVSQWADRFRIISERFGNPEPGQWSTDRTPYLREPMDAMSDPEVDDVGIMKAAQVGGSDGCARNPLAFWIDQDPGPALLVYPTEPAAIEQLRTRIIPLVEDTPSLARHMLGTSTKLVAGQGLQIDLDSMSIWCAWAGSPTALASRPIRYVILDEIDKFPPYSGREADPQALAVARTRTFGHRRKIIRISTPTKTTGAIYVFWEGCADRRRYHVPCPACGLFQHLEFERLKWTHEPGESAEKQIERLEAHESPAAVWYECANPACKHAIHERERDDLIARGQWVSEGYPPGEHPKTRRRAYHISGLVATIGVTWRFFVVKHLRVRDDPAKLQEFVNQDLGEPDRNLLLDVKGDVLREKAKRAAALGRIRGLVPSWAGLLISTADTQKDYFSWSTWAWGRGERARVIDWGTAKTFDDLRRATLGAQYPIDGSEEIASVPRLWIDSGGAGAFGASPDVDSSRTDEVYRFSKTDPDRIFCVKGWGGKTGRPADPIRMKDHEYKPAGARVALFSVWLHFFDTQYFKDVLARRLGQEVAPGGIEAIELCDELPDDWFEQMVSEEKTAVRIGMSTDLRWQKKRHGIRNERWDEAVYQVAAARAEKVEFMEDEAALVREREAVSAARGSPKRPPSSKFAPPDGRPYVASRR